MNYWNTKNSLWVSIIALMSLIFVSSTAINFPLEPAIEYPDKEQCIVTAIKNKFDEDICSHREFLNSAWGDSLEYFTIAAGEESYPPYSLRPLVPKVIGTIAKLTLPEKSEVNKYLLFKRISIINQIISLFCAALLALIPFIYFKDLILKEPSISLLIISLNVVNIGVLQTSLFFMLDMVSYVVFTLAACAFFSRKILLLSVICCFGILVKEISILLCIPIFFLWVLNYKNKFLNIIPLFLPVLVFVGLRWIMNEDLLSVQYGWKLSEGEVKLNYLNYHLGGLSNVIMFFIKIACSLGGALLISFYIYMKYKEEKILYLSILIFILATILANALLASRVPRVLVITIPFLVFYSLYVIQGLKFKTKVD